MANSKDTVKITTEKFTLRSVVDCSSCSDALKIDIQFILSATTDNMDYEKDKFGIPWQDLKKSLSNLAIKIKTYNSALNVDEYSQELISSFISDKNIFSLGGKNRIVNILDVENVLKQNGFLRKLKNVQRRDVTNLLELKHGANFSVPGAGKTTSMLAVHFYLKSLKEIDKLFIVAPINAFISWEDELKEIFPGKKINIIRVNSRILENFSLIENLNPHIILINYEKFRSSFPALTNLFSKYKMHFVLDESHRIKSGRNNLSYNQIRFLGDIAIRRDIMSGTPMPQSIMDLYPQFNFLWSGINFLPRLTNDVETDIPQINSSITGLYVRTTKDELELQKPKVIYTNVELGFLQKQLYMLIKSEAARQLSGMNTDNITMFRKFSRCVIRLLQASVNPMLLTANDAYDDEIFPLPPELGIWDLLNDFVKYEKPSKITYLLNRINDLLNTSQKKIVIWTYFVRNIKLLELLLEKYNPVSIFGEVAPGDESDINSREGRIRVFHNDPSCKILLGNPQACGEGISLHKVCHYAIYLDRNFNAAHYLQSIDRIHRLGLSKDTETTIEIIESSATIDSHLRERLNKKVILMADVLNDKHLKTLVYDPSDIADDEQNGIDKQDINQVLDHINSHE